jgi:solute carrier family 30 (zinc transporter), member 9
MAGHGEDSSLKAVIVAVGVNAFIMVAKYVGAVLTASPALLAEAIHTTADVGNQVLLWIGIRQSQNAATAEHPYGWGAARWMWNLKSAMGIFFLGCGVTAYHGVHSLTAALHHDAKPPEPSMLGLGILVMSFVLELYSFYVAMKGIDGARGDVPFFEFLREGDDPTGVGVLLEDAAAILGVLLALVGVGLSQWLKNPLPDAIATIVIAALLGWVAFFLAKSNGRLLVGASVGVKGEQRIRAALLADEVVERVEDMKTEVLGAGRARVKCEIDLRESFLALRMKDDLTREAERLKQGVDPMTVLQEVAALAMKKTALEIERLHRLVDATIPEAAHVDLKLIDPHQPPASPGAK